MIIETEQEFQILKEAGKKLASILSKVMEKARVGITTLELDETAEELILTNLKILIENIKIAEIRYSEHRITPN